MLTLAQAAPTNSVVPDTATVRPTEPFVTVVTVPMEEFWEPPPVGSPPTATHSLFDRLTQATPKKTVGPGTVSVPPGSPFVAGSTTASVDVMPARLNPTARQNGSLVHATP